MRRQAADSYAARGGDGAGRGLFHQCLRELPGVQPDAGRLAHRAYQQRFGHEFNPGPAAKAPPGSGLALEEVTLADRMRKLGYATGMVGKWHLGYEPKYHPLKRGFDEFFGFLGRRISYLDSQADADNPIRRDDRKVSEDEYLTDAFAREAVAFIGRHKQEPFFLYVPFNGVHAPMEATEKYVSRFDAQNGKRRTFSGMLSAVDDAVGRILAKLGEDQLDENTLVFFISDNGGPTAKTTSRNDPLRGFKGQVWEGGIRVPMVMQWKGHLPAGEVYTEPVIALDILPTAVAAAGGSPTGGKPLDGVDLLPYLTGKKSGRPHQTLFWRFGPQWAVRDGDLKLLKTAGGEPQLFDLASDISEQHDLAGEQPQTVAKLTKEYEAWNAELQPPKWQPPRRGGQRQRARRRANTPSS